jgi:uncharacterized membrane protein
MPATSSFAFDAAWIIAPGVILILGLLGSMAWQLSRRGLAWLEIAALVALRAIVLLEILVLAARPVAVQSVGQRSDPYVAVLMDRSLSMSLRDGGQPRFNEAYDYLKDKLAPALLKQNWKIHPWLFAETAKPASGDEVAAAITTVDGKRTNLAGAFFQAATSGAEAPVAIIALTDGNANDNTENTKAISALLDRRIPVYGIGFGSDAGPPTLALEKVTAPSVVPAKQQFRVSAELSVSGSSDLPNFELMLLRDGQLAQTKTVSAFSGSRSWAETFPVTEPEEGRHNYTVQLMPPTIDPLVVGQKTGTAQVNISNEKDLRILFVQGTLTWDYKFILRALHSDPAVRVTGLSRTSDHSTYRQNVEKAGELIDGFPTSLEQISPYQVVVISNLKAADLTAAQQDVLTRYCGELGGGLLLLGGAETFDDSWQGSALEKLLPVTFDSNPGLTALDQPFHLKLTDEALRNPIFQITDDTDNAAAWQTLPAFTQYGRVEKAKPGATVWAEHETDVGPQGNKRILMASQNFGAGRSAVICVQNFWRWRLAKESNPDQFDRFWRQFFRWLGEAGKQTVLIDFANQELTPPTDLHILLDRQMSSSDLANSGAPTPKLLNLFTVIITGPDQKELYHNSLELPPNQPVPLTVHAEAEGLYSIVIQDAEQREVAERNLQLVNNRIELQSTGRDMENLKQWASLTGGKALAVEDAQDVAALALEMQKQIQLEEKADSTRVPWGLNGWMLTLLLGSVALEWLLRKRWNLL